MQSVMSKEERGLGVRNLRDMNLVFLRKWWQLSV